MWYSPPTFPRSKMETEFQRWAVTPPGAVEDSLFLGVVMGFKLLGKGG